MKQIFPKIAQLLAIACLILITFSVNAVTPVFIVAGKVTNHDGTDADTGLKVIVKNETRPSIPSKETTVGEKMAGEYRVTFIDTDGGIVADVGDMFKVEIRDVDDSLLESRTYQITSSDIGATRAIIDVQLPSELEIMGDVSGNGLVTAYDATLVFQHIGGIIQLDDAQKDRADVDNDGSVTASDAKQILRKVVGLIDDF